MRPAKFSFFDHRPDHVQWAVLLALSLGLAVIAEGMKLPAALLIAPMIAGMLVGAGEGRIRVPTGLFVLAQSMIGCMIGNSIPLSILQELGRDWLLFLAGILSVIAAASALGLLLTRLSVLPGTTAIWGTSPGASTTMILMSETYGGDIRLVAVMQYLRVVCVAIVATFVSKLLLVSAAAPVPAIVWFPRVSPYSFILTLALAGSCAVVATVLRIPAGPILLPIAAVIILHETTSATIALPPWWLALCYMVVGWSIGLRFTRPILAHALRALPAILASILTLIALCGLIAAALVVFAGVEPLTAYLATSPGGVDTVAIIAASSNVDQRFVMTMQTLRLIAALIVSPFLARYIARREIRSAEPDG